MGYKNNSTRNNEIENILVNDIIENIYSGFKIQESIIKNIIHFNDENICRILLAFNNQCDAYIYYVNNIP